MMRPFIPLSLVVLLSVHSPAIVSAQSMWTCGAGVVRTIEAIDKAVTHRTAAAPRDNDADVEPFAVQADVPHRRSYVLTVQLGDVLYTSESTGDPDGTLDPLRLVVGAPIDMCVNATQMIVETPEGADYRAPIVRRAPAPARTSFARSSIDSIRK